MQALLSAHRRFISVKGDTLLLRWGTRPETPARSGTPNPSDHGSFHENYAAILEAATDIATLVDKSGSDESVLARYWVRHNGVNYTWSEFCYGPSTSDLVRLRESITTVFDGQARWPRLARAIVEDSAYVNSSGRISIRLRSAVETDSETPEALYLFASAGSAGAAAMRELRKGTQVLALADDWFILDKTGKAGVSISSDQQISPMS
ncbi:hypothetical protein C5C17_00110 [Pseudoclavibacter sp. RFBA6]|nr:hypothetical protein C5C17_00110 [Pseudoclavibacter sp. RFBA6]